LLRCDDSYRNGSVSGNSSSDNVERDFLATVALGAFNSKATRLIEWNVDELVCPLKQIVSVKWYFVPILNAKRNASAKADCTIASNAADTSSCNITPTNTNRDHRQLSFTVPRNKTSTDDDNNNNSTNI
jgi:hypothetical protein